MTLLNRLITLVFIFLLLISGTIQANIPVIRYKAEIGYPPFKFVQGNNLKGFDIDFTELLFESRDYSIEYSSGTWDKVYDDLVKGRIDTCGMMAVSDERKKHILYSKTVFKTYIALYAKKNTPGVSINNLSKYRIAVGKGQYAESLLKDKLHIDDYLTFNTVEEAIDSLDRGEADLLFENQEVVNYFLIEKKLKGEIIPQATNLFPTEIAYGVNRNRPDLVGYMNERITKLQKTGVYDELYQKYFFVHSDYYHKANERRLIVIISVIAFVIILLFILLRQYIIRLRRKIMKVNTELYLQFSKLKEQEKELKLSEDRYRLAIDGSNDGLWDCDLKEGRLFFSSKCRSMLGYDDEELNGEIKVWADLTHPDDIKVIRDTAARYLNREIPRFSVEYRAMTKDGYYKWILGRGKAIWDENGKPVRMAGSVTDITERKEFEERINYLAYYDSLTGLPNRALFIERLNESIAKTQKENGKGALLFLDLDNFKAVNDTLGHSYGDLLLENVGIALRKHMGKNDTVARLGGDEFIILIPRLEEISAVEVLAGTLVNAFRIPWKLMGYEFHITASVGVTIFPDHGQDEQTLLKNADSAMYKAKEQGKNNYQFYTESMNAKIIERLEMENSLHNALERGEFILHYQPQVEICTGRIVGVEALLRWNHPAKGLVSPLKFIPLAEATGLIVPIGEWVLHTACKQAVSWQKMGLPPRIVAVNLSARQFQQQNLVEIIRRVLDETGLDPQWLELEITESIAVMDLEFAVSMLHRLRDMGIRIALDDFGTGYSSLCYLKSLPINSLKIDKTFVHDMTENLNEEAIAKAVINLARSLNLMVTAEGVETKEQLVLLKEHLCSRAQGYLFSKPLPPEEVLSLLRKDSIL